MPARPKVLIVEDEPAIRMITRTVLSGAGYEVTEAESGVAALAAVGAAGPFALILLDLGLPGGDGATLLPELRKRSPASRVLVVSGLTQDDVGDIGSDGFLGKPFTKAKLLDAVGKALGT